MYPHDHEGGVHQISLEPFEDYDITTEPFSTWEETIRDAWEPIQLWPDLVLPCDKPQVTYITQTVLRAPQVTQVTQASQASSGPSTSTGGPGNVSQDKLMQLLSLHKQTAKVLQELGLDPGTTQVEESTSDAIPIPLDSSVCPVCNKQMSSHYRAVLHYRYRHLHRTKWYCQICNKYFTSQANLDEHEYTKHGDTQFSCYICDFTSEHKRHLKTHLKSHKRYKTAKSDGLICEHCLHRKLDVQGHQKTCIHNPNRDMQRYACRNKPCTSNFNMLKHRNYHEKKKCKHRPT